MNISKNSLIMNKDTFAFRFKDHLITLNIFILIIYMENNWVNVNLKSNSPEAKYLFSAKIIEDYNTSPEYYKKNFETILKKYLGKNKKLTITELFSIQREFESIIITNLNYLFVKQFLSLKNNKKSKKIEKEIERTNIYVQIPSYFITTNIAKKYKNNAFITI